MPFDIRWRTTLFRKIFWYTIIKFKLHCGSFMKLLKINNRSYIYLLQSDVHKVSVNWDCIPKLRIIEEISMKENQYDNPSKMTFSEIWELFDVHIPRYIIEYIDSSMNVATTLYNYMAMTKQIKPKWDASNYTFLRQSLKSFGYQIARKDPFPVNENNTSYIIDVI